jgi:hypothetical protein
MILFLSLGCFLLGLSVLRQTQGVNPESPGMD